MINTIKRLLGIHIHDWTQWTVVKSYSADSHGRVKLIQTRLCKECNKIQLASQEV